MVTVSNVKNHRLSPADPQLLYVPPSFDNRVRMNRLGRDERAPGRGSRSGLRVVWSITVNPWL